MPKLRVLSGAEVVKILAIFGFKIASQRGSHIKLRRIEGGGGQQTLTIPNHKELEPWNSRRDLSAGIALCSGERTSGAFLRGVVRQPVPKMPRQSRRFPLAKMWQGTCPLIAKSTMSRAPGGGIPQIANASLIGSVVSLDLWNLAQSPRGNA
jgi:predicted RNA binding protein YcfA (HicA-like mRNA interferase family)